MAAINELPRPLSSSAARPSHQQKEDEDETANAVARTLNQTTSGIFIDTGKKVALTTQRKVPLPKIFRTKSSDSGSKLDRSTWSCSHCRYENAEDENPVCGLCGSSRALSPRESSAVKRTTPTDTVLQSSLVLPTESPQIVPINPFDTIVENNPQTSAITNEAPKIQRGHSFDDSWFAPARSRNNSTDSHSLPDEIPLEPKKPPRRRNKSADDSPLPMFQSPDYLPPMQVTTRLNGNGGSSSTMSKPTRTARRFLFGRRRASTS